MIRNPKGFGVWPACPSGVYFVITKLEMLPTSFDLSLHLFFSHINRL